MSTRPPSLVRADRDIYSVGRLNREVRQLLDHGLPLLWVEGEISNFSRPASGHWYFSLKDRDAQVRCAMFRGRNAVLRMTPRDGQRVLVRARAGLFEARGEFQPSSKGLPHAGRVGKVRRHDDIGHVAACFRRKGPSHLRGLVTEQSTLVRDVQIEYREEWSLAIGPVSPVGLAARLVPAGVE